jgi:hypothetical protein
LYELALGAQPVAYRGTPICVHLDDNAQRVHEVLSQALRSPSPELRAVRGQVYGSAYLALALVAYNTGRRPLSRRFAIRALRENAGLWRDTRVPILLAKAALRPEVLNVARRIRRRLVAARPVIARLGWLDEPG